MLLQVPQNKVNRITLFSRFNYAFQNYSSTDFYYQPPLNGSNGNRYLYFQSDYPGMATVDWGDGITEEYEFIHSSNGYYICAFRSLYIDYYKNPASTNKGWSFGTNRQTGEIIIPYANHHYEDDNMDKLRTIVITFTNDIKNFYTSALIMESFPVLEFPALKELYLSTTRDIQEVPVDRISRLTHLTSLVLTTLGNRIEFIPDSIFELTYLNTLTWDAGLNLLDPDSSNIRKIKNLVNLATLNLRSCYLTHYLKEFNELPNLKTLRIGNGSELTDTPHFDEVSQINQNLTTFDWSANHNGNSGGRTNWGEQVTGMGLENLTSFLAAYASSLSLELPEYIKEMRSMASFNIQSSLNTQLRTDTFIDNFYEYIINWEYTTRSQLGSDGKRNQFYGLSVVTYNSAYPTRAFRPTGILQAPEGFEEKVSDGNPTTPMEKIFVLIENYNQEWTLKPADTDALSDSIFPELEYNQIIDNRMIVSKEGVIYKNEIITLSDEEL